jgi:catechol 2,3-dioxygenase-like lactoylglutathione lyase family enzyme
MTRRELARFLTGFAAARTLRSAAPILSVSGVDHLKVRVASAGASAMFYYGLFGGDIVPVRNTTFPSSPLVDEVFFKIGAPPFPYLMLSGIRGGESPGLDHLSVLAGNPVLARATLTANGISLIDPAQGLWFRDPDGTLIELMPGPTWGLQAQSMRLPVPSNLRSLRPAFETEALTRIHLRVVDIGRASSFYSQIFGRDKSTGERRFTYGATVLQLNQVAGVKAPGLDRLVIAVRNFKPKQARRILEQRGIQPSGSRQEVIFHDPDGNELELVSA